MTNLGASIGTAVAGAVLISALTSSFLTGIEQNPAVPKDVSAQATVKLENGAPFVSDKELDAALTDAGVSGTTADAIVRENADARIDALRASLAVLAAFALAAQYATRKIPRTRTPTEAPVTA